jgi:putative sporulation protein YtaF
VRWIAILGIALANNLDNLGVGIAFGVARIRLGPLINLWIALLTFVMTGVAVLFGNHLGSLLALPLAHALSAAILCGMGIWMLLATPRPDGPERPPEDAGRVSLRQILSDPTRADQNRSRDIDAREATLLAVAVSLNNLGGGVGAGLAHLSALWTALSSAMVSFLVVWLGAWAGGRLGGARLGKQAQTIAGSLLVLVGLWQLH